MPYFRARVHDGKTENVLEEKFKDEASLREQLPKRGWATILSVEEIPEPAAAPAPMETPPPPIRADQIREDGAWVYLPQELAEQHPLHGIGGWTGLLLAMMILGAAITLWPLFQLGTFLGYGGVILALFLVVLALELVSIVCIVLLATRSPAFPTTFIVLTGANIAATFLLFALGDYSTGNASGVIGNIIWLSYVLMSRRVNVTFRRRVEREDDWLKQGLAASGAPALAPARP